jgi:putative chitinase
MNTILPSQNGITPHITGTYGEVRGAKVHKGIDFNYNIPGQKGINLEHPNVQSPVEGVVTFSGGKYGTVKIRTDDGHSHEVLHMKIVKVNVKDRVKAGDVIGTMGGTGPKGPKQYAQHVHYQVKDKNDQLLNPETLEP